MKERPILFNSEMVHAILDGRKTQTRRVVKLKHYRDSIQPEKCKHIWPAKRIEMRCEHCKTFDEVIYICPFGKPGDRLWVRETFSLPHSEDDHSGVWYWASGNPRFGDWSKPKPSIHMPRWASRIMLKITDIRVQRIQDISEEDAIIEGIYYYHSQSAGLEVEPYYKSLMPPKELFKMLWNSINKKHSWKSNPWVWVIEFEVVK